MELRSHVRVRGRHACPHFGLLAALNASCSSRVNDKCPVVGSLSILPERARVVRVRRCDDVLGVGVTIVAADNFVDTVDVGGMHAAGLAVECFERTVTPFALVACRCGCPRIDSPPVHVERVGFTACRLLRVPWHRRVQTNVLEHLVAFFLLGDDDTDLLRCLHLPFETFELPVGRVLERTAG